MSDEKHTSTLPLAAIKCRYDCGNPVTHFCEECASGISGKSGFFCEHHAKRHDDLIKQNGGTMFAIRIKTQ